MARSTTQKTLAAADQLLAWLQDQRPVAPAAATSAPDAAAAVLPSPTTITQKAPAAADRIAPVDRIAPTFRASNAPPTRLSPAPMRLPHPDWLHHRLVVSGPAEAVTAFRTAAAGCGIIPFPLDLDRLEEDAFHLLIAPPPPQRRSLSAAGARVLAGQLREAAGRRHAAAMARLGRSTACPFDLHALLPVPDAILLLGSDHADAVQWLWQHWGSTQALRHVQEDRFAILGRHPVLRRDPGALHLSFWSADWTPWRALASIFHQWPALRFQIRPDYMRPDYMRPDCDHP